MNYTVPNKIPPLQFLSPLHRTMRMVADHLGRRSASTGLTTTEAHLLSYLRSYGPSPIGAVVRVFGLKKSTLTGVADRLVEKGLLTRSLNPGDRRSFVLALTEAGRQRAGRVRLILDAFEEQVAEQITAEDLQGFHEVLTAIARVAAPESEKEDPP